MPDLPITLRPARAADQPIISAMVRGARLNPLDLKWPNFLVAAEGERIVGLGQVKPHGDGSRELASLVVIPERQGQDIGSALVQALLRRETGPVYLFCAATLAGYYARFGFHTVEHDRLPRVMARIHRLVNLMMGIMSRLTGHEERVIAMRREG